jgi:hypothetical protein
MSRWLKTTLIVVGGVVILLAGVIALSLPSGSIQTSEDGTHSIDLAMLSVPIAEMDPLLEGPDQFLGVVHPQPDFDTNELGPDLTFVQDTAADLPALDPAEVLRAVYLGHDVNGDPYYIWLSGSPEFRQLIGQIIADWGSLGRFETSYGSEEVGPALWERDRQAYIAEHGLTTGSISSGSTSDGVTFTAEWHGLPDEVAAVVFYQGGEAIGWQRPVSGTAAFQFRYGMEQDPLDLGGEMVALTATGDEWERYELFPG